MAKTYFDIPDTCIYCKNNLLAIKEGKEYLVKCKTNGCNFPAEYRDQVHNANDPDQDLTKKKKG